MVSSLLNKFIFLIICICCLSCEDTNTEGQPPNQQAESNSKSPTAAATSSNIAQRDCLIEGEILEGNELVLKEQYKLVCITADSSTHDSNLGMSHRILNFYDTKACSLELKVTLPINESPDFPYYLADVNYNKTSKIVAIKAAKSIYCLDLLGRKLLPELKPKFKTKRNSVDASSGYITHLELWENYLIGWAQDKGTFIFDLNTKSPTPSYPIAEWQRGTDIYSSLFILPSDKGKSQLVIPNYNFDEETFEVNPILETPQVIKTEISQNALNNRFIVFRYQEDNKALVIDMKERTKIKLPSQLANQPTKAILNWAKTREST